MAKRVWTRDDETGENTWEPDSGGGSQSFALVSVPVAHNTPNFLTGIVGATLAEGDVLLSAAASIDTTFNGSSATATITGDPSDLTDGFNLSLTNAPDQQQGISNIYNVSTGTLNDAGMIAKGGAGALYLVLNDGSGGDPGSTVGVATVLLFIARAA